MKTTKAVTTVALSIALLSNTVAFAETTGGTTEDGFSIDSVKSHFFDNIEGADNAPETSHPESYGEDFSVAVRLIYFDTPTNPNRAALQVGAAPTPGTYCLATNGTLGTLGLVPPDWSDGS
ncbi:hypothetical protein, partial [Rothia nasimurium]